MATLAPMNSIAELRQTRLHDCRLTADRKLETLDEAEAFLVDRGVLTLTQDSALPSLFAATHEEPYKRGAASSPFDPECTRSRCTAARCCSAISPRCARWIRSRERRSLRPTAPVTRARGSSGICGPRDRRRSTTSKASSAS